MSITENITKQTLENVTQPVFGSVPNLIYSITSPETGAISAPAGSSYEGVYTISFDFTGTPVSNERLFTLFTDSNNYILINVTSAGNLQLAVQTGGASNLNTSIALADYLLDQGQTTITLGLDSTKAYLAVNGITVLRQESYTKPVGTLTTIGIGSTNTGSLALSDTINYFRIYRTWNGTKAQLNTIGNHTSFGISATYNPNSRGISNLGQSNALFSGATEARNNVTFQNGSDIKNIKKDGTDETLSAAAVASTALYSVLQQGGDINFPGLVADILLTNNYGTKYHVCHPNRGATGLHVAGANGQWAVWSTSGTVHTMRTLPFAAIMMEKISNLYGHHSVRIWQQGESDAATASAVTEAEYETDLNALLDELDLYSTPTITIIRGLHDAPASGYNGWADITAALEDVADARDNTYFISGTGLDTVSGDDLHIEIDGAIVLAHDVAAEIAERLDGAGGTIPFDVRLVPELVEYSDVTITAQTSEPSFTASEQHTFIFTATISSEYNSTQFLMNLGFLAESRVGLNGTNGRVFWQKNSTGGSDIASTTNLIGTKFILGIVITDLSTLEYALNSDTKNGLQVTNPDDDYASYTTNVWMPNNPTNCEINSRLHTTQDMYEGLLSRVITQMATDESITIQ